MDWDDPHSRNKRARASDDFDDAQLHYNPAQYYNQNNQAPMMTPYPPTSQTPPELSTMYNPTYTDFPNMNRPANYWRQSRVSCNTFDPYFDSNALRAVAPFNDQPEGSYMDNYDAQLNRQQLQRSKQMVGSKVGHEYPSFQDGSFMNMMPPARHLAVPSQMTTSGQSPMDRLYHPQFLNHGQVQAPSATHNDTSNPKKRKRSNSSEAHGKPTIHDITLNNPKRRKIRDPSKVTPYQDSRRSFPLCGDWDNQHFVTSGDHDGEAAALQYLSRRRWRPKIAYEDDTTIPRTGPEKEAWAKRAYEAMVNISDALDNENCNHITRWTRGYYEQKEVQARCWELVMLTIDLHQNGSTVNPLDDFSDNNRSECRLLNFEERFNLIIRAVKERKSIACDVMTAAKTKALVTNPEHFMLTKARNQIGNTVRTYRYRKGNEIPRDTIPIQRMRTRTGTGKKVRSRERVATQEVHKEPTTETHKGPIKKPNSKAHKKATPYMNQEPAQEAHMQLTPDGHWEPAPEVYDEVTPQDGGEEQDEVLNFNQWLDTDYLGWD